MNNINKGNEIRLCSIEQHTTPLILIYYYCIYTVPFVRVCFVREVDYEPQRYLADRGQNRKWMNKCEREKIKRFPVVAA